MPAFKVAVNGAHLATAARPAKGLLICSAMSGQRLVREPKPGEAKELEDYLELSLSAVTDREHLTWVEGLALQPGDVVTLTVADAEAGEEPTSRGPKD